MSVQLLLLLALVGPFCAFTHASPTEPPTSSGPWTTEAETHVPSEATVTEEALLSVTVTLTPPATEPMTTPKEVITEAVSEVSTVLETDTPDPAVAVTDPLTTTPIPPAVDTEEPTELVKTEQPVVTGAAEAEMGEEVVVEDDPVEGLGSGQVVGIVIGSLLAVIFVTAVVIVVVRRMGKYSP